MSPSRLCEQLTTSAHIEGNVKQYVAREWIEQAVSRGRDIHDRHDLQPYDDFDTLDSFFPGWRVRGHL